MTTSHWPRSRGLARRAFALAALLALLPLRLEASLGRVGSPPSSDARRVYLSQVGLALLTSASHPLRRYMDQVSREELSLGPLARALARERASNRRSAFLWPSLCPSRYQVENQFLNLLAPLADKWGLLDLAQVDAVLGRKVRRVVERLVQIPVDERRLAGTPLSLLLDYLRPVTLKRILPALKAHQDMPIFAYLARRLGPLQGARLFLGNAHFLADTEQLFGSLRHPDLQVAAWAKPHSTDPMVATSLHLSGCRVREIPVDRDIPAVVAEARALLAGIAHPERHQSPLLVLFDDGGQLIKAVAELVVREFPKHGHLVAAAENTTRGIRRLSKPNVVLPFPVVDIARSWAKTIYGSPMLGYSVVRQTTHHLDRLARQGIRPLQKKLVIIGAGPMGLAVARAFKQTRPDYQILIHDRDPLALQEAGREFAVEGDKQKALAEGYLVMSVAGARTLSNRSMGWLPDGAIVVNAASPGEFAIHRTESTYPVSSRHDRRSGHLHSTFQGRSVDLGAALGQDMHMVWQHRDGKRVLVVRGGQVVNFPFDLSPDRGRPIPGRYIQLPVGLMYLGIKQAAEGGEPGIQPLRLKPQQDLVSAVERSLARGEHRSGDKPDSLLDPRW